MGKRILVALVAAIVLALGYGLLVRKQNAQAFRERALHRLPAFDDRAVTGFTLSVAGTGWRFERRAAGWRLLAPVDDAASVEAVDALVAAARRAPIVQTIAEPEALSTYGLDPAVAVLDLDGVAAPELSIGSPAPSGDGVFAKLAGRNEVLILGPPDAEVLTGIEPARLRDAALFDIGQSTVGGVEIATPDGVVALAKAGGAWWIEKPARLPASANQIERLLSGLYAARVTGFVDGADRRDAKFGVGPAAPRFTVSSEGARRTVTIGATAGEQTRYVASDARASVLVVTIPSLSTLPLTVDALRETRLTTVNRYDVTRVSYTAGTRSFVAARHDDTTWTTDGGASVPAEDVYGLLVGLLEPRTTGWSAREPRGEPVATLDYELAAGTKGRVRFYGSIASWSEIPGASFSIGAAPPPVPAP